MKKNILLLGDLTGRSRVALRMLIAALEAHGHEALAVPTALISNTLNLGQHASLDTTAYMLETLRVYERLGIRYDFVYIGYITGLAQARALCTVAEEARAAGVPVLLDPILGDGGKRYNAVIQEQEEGMRLLARHVSLMTPNLTEAALLAGMPYERVCQGAEGSRLAQALTQDGCAAVVTSAKDAAGGAAVLVCEPGKEPLALGYEPLPGHHFGTGDLYCAELMAALLDGQTLPEAARRAAERVAGELRRAEAGLLPGD